MVVISTCNKEMADAEKVLNDGMKSFSDNTVDTPEKGVEQHKKRDCLKCSISKGKAYLLGGKWTQKK